MVGFVSISIIFVISFSDYINNEIFWFKIVREWVFEFFIVVFCCKIKNRNINLVMYIFVFCFIVKSNNEGFENLFFDGFELESFIVYVIVRVYDRSGVYVNGFC